jgi:GT2 family glycosyltransferase
MIQVSIIVVNYNSAQWVKTCIQSIYDWTKEIDFELILVDNNSTEREIESIKDQFLEVKYIQLDNNIGFGQACNKAVSLAQGEFLFFLNPDTKLINNSLKYFINYWEFNCLTEKISCLGGLLINEFGMNIHSYGYFPVKNRVLIEKVKSNFRKIFNKKTKGKVNVQGFKNGSFLVEYVTGANLFVSKKNFDLVNGFDPDFFLYFEETDFQFRLNEIGLKSRIIEGPIIVHHQGLSSKKNLKLINDYYLKSMMIYFKKHSNYISFITFKIIWYILDFKTFFQRRLNTKQNP